MVDTVTTGRRGGRRKTASRVWGGVADSPNRLVAVGELGEWLPYGFLGACVLSRGSAANTTCYAELQQYAAGHGIIKDGVYVTC